MALFHTTAALPTFGPKLPPHRFRARRPTLCRQSQSSGDASPTMDRRGMLIGLSGLYGAAHATAPAEAHPGHHHIKPSTDTPVDFVLPPQGAPKRVRRPAHLVDSADIAKYAEGLKMMMELPEDHPWNFDRHATTHPPGVHNGWLFLPWHRLYIHFFERAIGRLVGDDSFALPYWNFDSPDGMTIPPLFDAAPGSPFHNPTRNPAHLPPAIIDLGYAYSSGDGTALEREQQIQQNLWEIGMAFKQSLPLGTLFSGGPVRGAEPLYGGRLENLHKAIHQWVGPKSAPWADMGNPHTTARDPMFYSLHANVDRLWDLYQGFRGNRDDYGGDTEWLDIAFTFHDEDGRTVRATVRDALDSDRLGYTYERAPLPWAGRVARPRLTPAPAYLTPAGEFGGGPSAVDWRGSPVRFAVPRPRGREGEGLVEVLHIKGIDVVPGEPARFDIFARGDGDGDDGYGVYVGNFIKPHVLNPHAAAGVGKDLLGKGVKKMEGLKLGIAPLLEELGVGEAAELVVTLVPRDGKVMVDGVGVELVETDGALLQN